MTTYVSDIERSFGLPPAAHVTAAEQLQKSYPRVGIQPLPEPYSPGRANAQMVGIKDSSDLAFLMAGDSGGIMQADAQHHVAKAMVDRLVQDQSIAFMYHDGDEVYFNGDADQYAPQFGEPYAHFNRPIVGVPGNHDGAVAVNDAGVQTGRAPLDTFMANFCDKAPHIPAWDLQFEYGRHTQTQPSHDWTLNLQSITIIGLYTNVPSGGHVEQRQIDWFVKELKEAPKELPLMLVLHHPPYSVDAHHGGSVHMGGMIDNAAKAAGRWPTIVVSGHVHDYQRFTRAVQYPQGSAGKYQINIPYVVLGNSGYHHLHNFAKDAKPGLKVSSDVVFNQGDDKHWGFMVVRARRGSVSCEYVSVDKVGKSVTGDTFVVHV